MKLPRTPEEFTQFALEHSDNTSTLVSLADKDKNGLSKLGDLFRWSRFVERAYPEYTSYHASDKPNMYLMSVCGVPIRYIRK